MKILIPVLEFGKAGGYRVLSNLANEWIKMGNQVDFLVPIASSKPYFPTKGNIYWVNKNGDFFDDDSLLPVKTYKFWTRWRSLSNGMKNLSNDYDIILANHSLTAYPVAFTKIKGKKIYYIQAYEPEYGKLNGNFGHKVLSYIAWNSYHLNLIKVVNADIYVKYKNICTNKVVLPGLDLELFSNKKIPSFSQNIKVGCIGRLEPYKGTKYVLKAFLLLQKQIPNIELHIAFGESYLSENYKSVYISTPKNDYELAEFYKSMNIFIAPGTVQLGAVHYPVIESMATGTPIITTSYFPADDSNAWIVPIKNAESIAEQVINIMDNPELRINKVKKAIEDVQQFEWKKVANKMYNYFLQN